MKPILFKKVFGKQAAYYYHNEGISVDHFNKYDKLVKDLTILGTSKTNTGKEFIALLEAKKYPIFMVQFHPEKHQFEKRLTYKDLDRSEDTIRLMSSFIFKLVESVRQYSYPLNDIPKQIQSYFSIYTIPEMSPVQSFERIYVFKNFFTSTKTSKPPKMLRLLSNIQYQLSKTTSGVKNKK